MQCFVFSFDEEVVDIMSLFGFAHPDISALVDWAQNTNLLACLLPVWFCLSLRTLAVVHFRVFPTYQLVTGGEKKKPAAVSVQHSFLYQQLPYSSVQDGTCVLRKVHVHSTPSLRSFPNVAFQMVPEFV